MLSNKEYKIFEVNNKNYLFTAEGFEKNPFSNIIMKEFRNDERQFFICKLNKTNILIFSQGDEFLEFLLEMGVKKESYEIASYDYYEKPRNYDNLKVELNDHLQLYIGVSHLEDSHHCYIKGENYLDDFGYEKNRFDTHFPRLAQLKNTSAKLIAEGEIDDENYKNYKTENSGCLLTFMFFGFILYYFLWS